MLFNSTLLCKAVKSCSRLCKTRISNPVVENIVLKFGISGVSVSSTTLKVSKEIFVPATDGTASGEFAVPASDLLKVLSRFSGKGREVSINWDGEKVTVESCGKGRVSALSLETISTDDFPPFIPEVEGFKADERTETLQRAFSLCAFATSDERARFQLGGVLLTFAADGLTFTATDGRRLSHYKAGGCFAGEHPEVSALIPAAAFEEILDFIPEGAATAFLTVGEKRLKAEFVGEGGVVVTVATTLLENNFPPFKGLLPTEEPGTMPGARVKRDEVLESLKDVSLMSNEKTLLVSLGWREGSVILEGEADKGSAVSLVDATTTGEPFAGKFNAAYLSEGLSAFAKGSWVGLTRAKNGMLYLFDEAETFIHAVMPMTIREEVEEVEEAEELEAVEAVEAA